MKRTNRLFLAVGTAALLLACSQSANAGLITFEDQPIGVVPGGSLTIVSDGVSVTFSAVGLQIRGPFGGSFPNTRTLSSSGDSSPITVTFGGALVDFAEIENIVNGRFTSEVDVISGSAFDSSNVLIDSFSGSATIERLDGPGIARIVYEDVNGTGYVLDNFNFTVGSVAVPEPSTLLTAAGSVVVLGLHRLRRKRVVDGNAPAQ